MSLIYFFRIFVSKSILLPKMFLKKGENNSLTVSLVQAELYSKSNQPFCHDPMPSCTDSYTEPTMTLQRFQQLGSGPLFLCLYSGFKQFEMYMWKWSFRNAEKLLVFFFHHIYTHAYMHTIYCIYLWQ